MAAYKGNLYVGCASNDSTVAPQVRKRTPGGTWSVSDTATGGSASQANLYHSLTVFSGNLYTVLVDLSSSSVLHMRMFNDTSWVTDKDMDATWGAGGSAISMILEFDGNLYYVHCNGTSSRTLRRVSGTWSSVDAPSLELNGMLGIVTV